MAAEFDETHLTTTMLARPALTAYAIAVVALTFKVVLVSQVTGIIRVTQGSFPAVEDYHLFKTMLGPAPAGVQPGDFGTPVRGLPVCPRARAWALLRAQR